MTKGVIKNNEKIDFRFLFIDISISFFVVKNRFACYHWSEKKKSQIQLIPHIIVKHF